MSTATLEPPRLGNIGDNPREIELEPIEEPATAPSVPAPAPEPAEPVPARLEARVQAGVEWLDANHPGWRDRINVRQLDLRDCVACVLGQVFEVAARGNIFYDGFHYASERHFPGRAWEYGFDLPPGVQPGGGAEAVWGRLDALWRAELTRDDVEVSAA